MSDDGFAPSDLQSRIHAAMEASSRAREKMREVGDALQARSDEHEKACLRGRQPQIKRARAALETAQAAYDAALREVERLDGMLEEVVQAQLRAAYL